MLGGRSSSTGGRSPHAALLMIGNSPGGAAEICTTGANKPSADPWTLHTGYVVIPVGGAGVSGISMALSGVQWLGGQSSQKMQMT